MFGPPKNVHTSPSKKSPLVKDPSPGNTESMPQCPACVTSDWGTLPRSRPRHRTSGDRVANDGGGVTFGKFLDKLAHEGGDQARLSRYIHVALAVSR